MSEPKITDVSLILGMSYALNCMMIYHIPQSNTKDDMASKLADIHTMINQIYYQDKK